MLKTPYIWKIGCLSMMVRTFWLWGSMLIWEFSMPQYWPVRREMCLNFLMKQVWVEISIQNTHSLRRISESFFMIQSWLTLKFILLQSSTLKPSLWSCLMFSLTILLKESICCELWCGWPAPPAEVGGGVLNWPGWSRCWIWRLEECCLEKR